MSFGIKNLEGANAEAARLKEVNDLLVVQERIIEDTMRTLRDEWPRWVVSERVRIGHAMIVPCDLVEVTPPKR